MGAWNPRANQIYLEAIELDSPERRQAYLDEACGADGALRAEVASLIAAADRAGEFLESPATGIEPEVAPELVETLERQRSESVPPLELPGALIGRYKLLEQIGEGGMGVVFRAEQTHPVRRTVALKVIRPGMDSRQVIARFEAERQALAVMDHPNIAKVLDAGTTDSGRPYFVMELVEGVPITDYCDAHQLSPRQRLELFIQVCRAVQHAHTKGVIHRDLKPTNVLVTLHDGVAMPKVIDFGVAKATGQTAVGQTLFTNLAQMIGTPLYMSPEQAAMSGVDVDTRSDVYSLGVLLYELLTGTTPFDRERLRTAAHDEVRRIIREEEPPRPSTRLSTTAERASIAACRGMEPKKLSGLVRGDLDWIVMRAMEKDRTRRYETANGLARDVERFLHDEPVHASPPSALYRFGKFARRHRAAVTILTLLTLMLLGTIVGQAAHNRALGREQAKTLAALGDAERGRNRARAALDQMSSALIDDWLSRLPKLSPKQNQLLNQAVASYEEYAHEAGDTPEQRFALAKAYHRVGDIRRRLGMNDESAHAYARARDVYQSLVHEHPEEPDYTHGLAGMHVNVAAIQCERGDWELALTSFRAARDLLEPLAPRYPLKPDYAGDLARAHNNVAAVEQTLGRPEEAAKSFEAARAVLETLIKQQPQVSHYRQDLATTFQNLAMLRGQYGAHDEALAFCQRALAIRQALAQFEPDYHEYTHETAESHSYIGIIQLSLKKPDEARRSFEAANALLGPLIRRHPGVPDYLTSAARGHLNLAIALIELDRLPEAVQSFEAARELLEPVVRDHPDVPEYAANLAATHYKRGLAEARLGEPEKAMKSTRDACALQEAVVKSQPDAPQGKIDLAGMYHNVAQLLADGGNGDEALVWYGKAIDVLTPVAQGAQPLTEARQNLSNCHSGRAIALCKLGRHDDAMKDLAQAVALDENKDPDDDLRQTLRTDAGLEPLRTRDDFRTLLARLQATSRPGTRPASTQP